MPKGPQLNKLKKNFTTRDSLGIEGVATSIAADICPVVTTVTPRAFYWPFLVWIYYDFYKYSGIKEHTGDALNRYVKKQDYFFVMATLLCDNPDKGNIAGITQCSIDCNDPGPYKYNKDYFKSRFGGMQYYNGGCDVMRLIVDRDPETGVVFPIAKLTKEGEKIALSFENVIKNTEYYKNYRLYDVPVPRDVLIEYGRIINVGLKGFEDSKSILKQRMFGANSQLTACSEYVRFLYDNYHIHNLTLDNARKILFDHITPEGKTIEVPDNIKKVADQWEILIGRQYFTSGLEMIWKSMLMKIGADEPADKRAWFERMIARSSFTWDIEDSLEGVISKCVYDYDSREKMIKEATRGKTLEWNLEDGIKIILSIYNWLESRHDLQEETKLFDYGVATHAISFNEFRNIVSEYKDRRIVDFMIYVMENWLCDQHYYTAFNKLMQGRDGFYYELVDGQYRRKHEFDIAFQGNRIVQLMQIMKDLDMLGN